MSLYKTPFYRCNRSSITKFDIHRMQNKCFLKQQNVFIQKLYYTIYDIVLE